MSQSDKITELIAMLKTLPINATYQEIGLNECIVHAHKDDGVYRKTIVLESRAIQQLKQDINKALLGDQAQFKLKINL